MDEDFEIDKIHRLVGRVWLRTWAPRIRMDAVQDTPVVGRGHKRQGVRGCALFHDGNELGSKCHGAECPSESRPQAHQGGSAFLSIEELVLGADSSR